MNNQTLGSYGETIAAQHLLDHGFQIVRRNVRTKLGEIDIVAHKTNTLHFVEVKTRIGDVHGKPYEAVGYRKILHMKRSAHIYVLKNRFNNHKLSLDVVSIILDPDRTVKSIKLFENITQ